MPFGSLWLPVVLSAVAVFVISAILHMVLKYHKRDYRGLPNEEAVRAAAEGLGATLDPPADAHGSAGYRRRLAEVSAIRAVLQAAARRK